MVTARRAWPLFLVILALSLYQGFSALDADPPLSLAGGPNTAEGVYVLDARNHVAGFPTVDDIPRVALLHPLGTKANILAFRQFGIGLRQARGLSVVLAGLSLVIFFILVCEASGAGTALLASLFLALHPVFVVYGRQANPASLTIFLMLLCILLWRLGAWRRLFLVPAGLVLILAAVVEDGPHNIFFLATAGLATLMVRMQAWKMSWAGFARARVRLFWGTAFLALLAWILLFLHPRQVEFLRALAPEFSSHAWGNVAQNLFMSPFTYWGFIRWAPALCLLAIGYFLVFGQSLMGAIARHRPLSETRVWFFCWLITGPLFMALRVERPFDVLLVLVPPICVAAAEGLIRLLSLRQVRKPHIDILVALGMLALAVWFTVQVVVHTTVQRHNQSIPHAFFEHQFRYEFLVVLVIAGSISILLGHLWLRWKEFTLNISRPGVFILFGLCLAGVVLGNLTPAVWQFNRTYDVRGAAAVISRLPRDAVVAGQWAPVATLDSGRRGMVIWPVLDSPGSLRRYGVSHLLLHRGTREALGANRILLDAEPDLPSRVRLLETLPMGPAQLDLYEVTPGGTP